MRRALLAAAFAAWLGLPASAHPLYLTGRIGTAPVLLSLEQNGEALAGWYVLLRSGRQIRLEGRRDAAGGFTLDEVASGNRKAGAFRGTVTDGRWRGTWRRVGGAPALPVGLAENRDRLDRLTTQLRCTARKADRKSGYTFSSSLRFGVRTGVVDRFALASAARSRNDEQQCMLAREDMTQVESKGGLLLQAEEAGAEPTQKCAVRIIGTAEYLYVAIGDGDGSEPGNDCRGVGDTRFCSARGTWSSLVVDRRRGTCRYVE